MNISRNGLRHKAIVLVHVHCTASVPSLRSSVATERPFLARWTLEAAAEEGIAGVTGNGNKNTAAGRVHISHVNAVAARAHTNETTVRHATATAHHTVSAARRATAGVAAEAAAAVVAVGTPGVVAGAGAVTDGGVGHARRLPA